MHDFTCVFVRYVVVQNMNIREMGASYFSFSTHASVPFVEQITSTYNIQPNYIITTSPQLVGKDKDLTFYITL